MKLRNRSSLCDWLDVNNMSERELARHAALGHATVNHLFTGRRDTCSFPTAIAIEAALGCSPGLLFEPETDSEATRLFSRMTKWRVSHVNAT